MDQSIFPECFLDTNLIETLVPPLRKNNQQGYNHQKGCGTVASRMKKQFADRFALGIIDKDKKEVDYLKEFDEVIYGDSLLLYKHKEKHHYIIQIRPAIERFIIDNAKAVNISLADFSLPLDFELFKKVSKTANSKNDPRFKSLFKALNKNNAPGILRLSKWVAFLKDCNYKADLERLKEL